MSYSGLVQSSFFFYLEKLDGREIKKAADITLFLSRPAIDLTLFYTVRLFYCFKEYYRFFEGYELCTFYIVREK